MSGTSSSESHSPQAQSEESPFVYKRHKTHPPESSLDASRRPQPTSPHSLPMPGLGGSGSMFPGVQSISEQPLSRRILFGSVLTFTFLASNAFYGSLFYYFFWYSPVQLPPLQDRLLAGVAQCEIEFPGHSQFWHAFRVVLNATLSNASAQMGPGKGGQGGAEMEAQVGRRNGLLILHPPTLDAHVTVRSMLRCVDRAWLALYNASLPVVGSRAEPEEAIRGARVRELLEVYNRDPSQRCFTFKPAPALAQDPAETAPRQPEAESQRVGLDAYLAQQEPLCAPIGGSSVGSVGNAWERVCEFSHACLYELHEMRPDAASILVGALGAHLGRSMYLMTAGVLSVPADARQQQMLSGQLDAQGWLEQMLGAHLGSSVLDALQAHIIVTLVI